MVLPLKMINNTINWIEILEKSLNITTNHVHIFNSQVSHQFSFNGVRLIWIQSRAFILPKPKKCPTCNLCLVIFTEAKSLSHPIFCVSEQTSWWED